MIRILIVDDHEVVRRGVRSLLSREKEIEVCGEAVDGQDAIAKAQELRPDVITMDISMPNLNGLEATREIRGILPDVYILVLSQHDSAAMMQQALEAGANGYVVKSAVSTDLVAALEKVKSGERSFARSVLESEQPNIDTQEVLQRSAAFEKALGESQRQLNLALESANTALFEWDMVKRSGRWNSQMTAIYGFTPERAEIDVAGWRRLFHPDDTDRLMKEAEETYRSKKDFHFEFRTIRPDGAVRWIQSKGRVVRNGEGNPIRLIGTHADITERKLAEERLGVGLRRQAALTQLADQLHRAKSLDDIYTAVFDAVNHALECERASILLYDNSGVMRFVSWRGLSNGYRKAAEGHSPWTRDEASALPVCMEDVQKSDIADGLKAVVLGEGIRALGFVPLISRGKLIGKFMLYYNAPHVFREEEIELSQTIARQLAFGIERKRTEQALRESEERFRMIVEATPECVKVVTKDGTLLHMNSAGLQMVGAKSNEMVLGKSVYQLIAAKDRERFRAFNERICAGEKGDLEYDIVSLDGKTRHMSTRAVPLWNPDGTVLQLAVTRDDTERKRTEQELTEKARLLDLSNDAILVRDATDRITFWSQGAVEMYGYSREEAMGRVSHEVFHTIFPEPLEEITEKLLRDQRWAGELLHTLAKGAKKTVSSRWSVERDAQGNVASILEINRDITEQKEAEQAQYRLAAIVECSDDAVISKNLNGVITSWNAAAERIFGFTADEAIGQPITIIIPPELQDEEKEILRRLRAGERVDHFETIRQTKDGMRRHVSLTISPVRDAQGRTVGASKIARDITQRRKIEHMLKEAELSGRLLQLQDEERRRVARELHDGVGQLLAAMGMNVGTIAQESGKLGPNAARCVEENAALVEQALTEIRTLSHLLHPPFLDEVGLVSALTEYVEGFGERSNIRVTVDLQAKQERLPHEYEMCLFRIVQECLTNIHRHSGSGTAQVRLLRVAGEIHLEVADQGRGISPEIQEKFFAGKSTGVGLRGMRERVRQLGGALQIQSDGDGTSVFVMLPIRDEGSTVSGGEMLSSEKNGDGGVAQAGAQGRVKPARKTTLM